MKLPKRIDKIYFGHLVVGIKDFIQTNDIGKSLITIYYNNLCNNLFPYDCDLCPLNDKFGIESTGCNSFLKELGYRNVKHYGCREMREIMFYALKEILYNKAVRFVKI
jgi:hypothetical protein